MYLLIIALLSPTGQPVPVAPQEFASRAECTRYLIATYGTPMRGYTLKSARCQVRK